MSTAAAAAGKRMQNILSELVPGMQQQPSSTDLPYWFGNWAAAAGTAQTANYRLKLAASLNLVICSGGSGRSGKIEEKSTEVWIRIFFKIKITTKTVFLSICRSPSFLLPINSSSSSKGSYDVFSAVQSKIIRRKIAVLLLILSPIYWTSKKEIDVKR